MNAPIKIAIVVGDGMGDYPMPELNGRTPLQAANIPNMRRIAGCGQVRLTKTVPPGLTPGSDVANLSLMGFDAREHYTGRAPIEAAGANIPMAEADVAYRCNLITTKNGLIQDHSAGHITTEEARPIIEMLSAKLGGNGRRFFVSTSYRHLLLWENGPADAQTVPPHDVLGQPVMRNLPRGPRSEELVALMTQSAPILAKHPVNQARRQAGKRAATQIWLWGQGRRVALPSYAERYGLSGAVISAVDLVRGIGRLAGLETIMVEGATGFVDTNYAGKVQAALDALARLDFVFLHVEAPDECSHAGDLQLKIQAIEAFDRHVVGPVWNGLEKTGCPYRLIIATDHCTPVSVRNHTSDPVPIAIVEGPAVVKSGEKPFDEFVAGGAEPEMAFELIRAALSR